MGMSWQLTSCGDGTTYLLGLCVLNAPLAGPLTLGGVDGLLLLVLGVEGGGEAVGLAANPAAAAVLNLARVSGRGLDVGCAVEFDVG